MMSLKHFSEEELSDMVELVEQREDKIDYLVDVLKVNGPMTEKKSNELIQDIFKINSQIKLEEEALIIKRTFGFANLLFER